MTTKIDPFQVYVLRSPPPSCCDDNGSYTVGFPDDKVMVSKVDDHLVHFIGCSGRIAFVTIFEFTEHYQLTSGGLFGI